MPDFYDMHVALCREKRTPKRTPLRDAASPTATRCLCSRTCARRGAFIPAVPKLSIEQASILIDRLAKHGISNSPDDAPLVPIQVIVAAGGPIVPYRREQGL